MNYFLILLLASLSSQAYSQTIEPAELSKNIGKTVTIYGKIYDGKYLSKLSSKPTLLDLGGSFPNQVASIVIEDSNRVLFNYKPEEYLKFRTVWVTGKVSIFNDQYRINISRSEDIIIDTTALVVTDETKDDFANDDKTIYSNPHNIAFFPGGADAWYTHEKRSQLPEIEGNDELKPAKYPVKVQFIVMKDSSITNVKAFMDSGHCHPCIAQVLQLIKNSPKWAPATQNGYAVNSIVNQVFYRKVIYLKTNRNTLLQSYIDHRLRGY